MQLGIFSSAASVDDLVGRADAARALGFGSFWTPQVFGIDALTSLAVVAQAVPDIRLGTAVVPTYPRHPMMMAQQALTTNQVAGGRLDLGIGLSHQPVVEGMWGISFDRPVAHMEDYLTILMALVHDGGISHAGAAVTSRGRIEVDAPAPTVLVAALGPKMLALTGRLADGTVTWMTGPVTVGEHTVPAIERAAEAAGRARPEVVAAVPICITDSVAAARERAAIDLAVYGELPSYRAMLDREGLEGPADIALVGSLDQVAEGLERYVAAGATTVVASVFGSRDERERALHDLATLH